MKKILLILFLSTSCFANCNFGLALAAESYILELEKEKLLSMQSQPCSVFDKVYQSCSMNDQRRLIAMMANMNDVSTICQPHWPPPSP